MINIVETGSDDLDRINTILAGIPDGARNATYNALQRAGAKAETEAGRFAAREYKISKSTFMKRVNVKAKTGMSGYSAPDGYVLRGLGAHTVTSLSLKFKGSVIPLIEFSTRFSRGGFHAQVKRNSGGGVIPRAFAERVYGPIRAFQRVGGARFPIQQLFGPSTAQMMANDSIVEDMTKTINETFDKRMDHEIWRLLSGHGG